MDKHQYHNVSSIEGDIWEPWHGKFVQDLCGSPWNCVGPLGLIVSWYWSPPWPPILKCVKIGSIAAEKISNFLIFPHAMKSCQTLPKHSKNILKMPQNCNKFTFIPKSEKNCKRAYSQTLRRMPKKLPKMWKNPNSLPIYKKPNKVIET